MASFSQVHLTSALVSFGFYRKPIKKQKSMQILSAHHHPSPSILPKDPMEPMQTLQTSIVTHVKRALLAQDNTLVCMNLIDRLQRLSIDYHFKEEIELCLSLHYKNFDPRNQEDLYSTSLWFRLMRQHGHYVSPEDVFNTFMDGDGKFNIRPIDGIQGILALHEASYFGFDGEDILNEANYFSRKQLQHLMAITDPYVARMVNLTLDQPIHRSIPRFSVKQYLAAITMEEGSLQNEITNNGGGLGNLSSLNVLASLDFNTIQAIHQKELRDLSRWWSDLGLAKELTLARNNPAEWYMYSLALLPDPKLSQYRVAITKSIALFFLIDDLYDIYGTLDQLVLFTEAIKRWETGDLSGLPSSMEICIRELYNTTNEIGSLILKDNGCNPNNIFKRQWSILCDAFLAEAKWNYNGISPKSDEYLNNGIISSGVPLVLIQTFFMLGQGINMDTVDWLQKMPSLIKSPATMLRLSNDLDNANELKSEEYDGSYVECYMKEMGSSTSVESATQHVKAMISNEWKKLNQECFIQSMFSPDFKTACLNSARVVQIVHSYEVKDRHNALKEHPIASLLGQKIHI